MSRNTKSKRPISSEGSRSMVESVAIIVVLGFFITAAAVAIYGAGYLILATPLMRWCLIAVVVVSWR